MSEADKWADPYAAGGTVQSKQLERDEIARQMAEFEAEHGPVETTPIIKPEMTPSQIQYVKKSKKGAAKPKCNQGLTEQRAKVLELIRRGINTPSEIARAMNVSKSRADTIIRWLLDNKYIDRPERGGYVERKYRRKGVTD